MTDLLMKVQLSQLNRADNSIELQLRAQDFAGAGDHGGVRVFDKQGHVVDLPLDYKDTIDNAAGPKDDMWVKKILIKDLPGGMSPTELRCTGFVDVDQADGGKFRIWEGTDHVVKEQDRDRLVDFDRTIDPNDHYSRASTRTVDVANGKLELVDCFKYDSHGYKSKCHERGVLGLRFTDTTGAYASTDKVQVLLIPQAYDNDRRGYFSEGFYVKRNNLRELDRMNLVTLTRQADGSFAADAPVGKAYLARSEYWGYYGDENGVKGYELALVNPVSGSWDSNNGANYYVAVS